MSNKKLSEEDKRNLDHLLSSNDMFVKSMDEARLRGKEESVRRLEAARQDVIAQIRQIDVDEAEKADLKAHKSSQIFDDASTPTLDRSSNIGEILAQYEASMKNSVEPKLEESKESVLPTLDVSSDVSVYNQIDSDVQYDIISLPSNGQCYKNKINRLPVGYLTAYDENLITSPNLYKDGLIIDFLLKQKVLDKGINLDDLCLGDVDAIILFLRATSYGPEFPITARDPESGEMVEAVVDLLSFKTKEFSLVGDDEGYFDFELPVSKDKVKFKFLTRKDEKMLKLLNQIESHGIKAKTIKESVSVLNEAIRTDGLIDGKTKQELLKDLGKYQDWVKKLESKSSVPFSRVITNRLELSVVEVNGNRDRGFISKYIKNMGAKDSLMLRRYILDNEPGINFEVEIERPASLGGGSFKTFLEWDDTVFLNIA